ncbi:MAG TPA: ComEC/Rec2 family competence protein [Acidimicrobiales bacterium]|nr:ComEC/Rec2 family competence protein [Acidimicrobiales bacterium]
MADRWVVALAVATFVGSLAAADGHVARVPLTLAAAVLALGLAIRRPGVLCVGAALLAASLGQRSIAGLEAPLDTGPVTGEVTLVSDPVPDGRGGVVVDVRLDGRRLRAHARVAPAAALDDRLAGERSLVVGEVRPPGPAESALRYRHLAGRLEVDAVVGWRPGGGVTRVANGLRRTLARGADVMSDRHASLLAGLTLGDDRDQPADMTDAFRAAGLTHILAVSGQNVAFVMVLVAPVLARLRFGPRLVVTLAVLAGFALVTRFEPSVLRATAMASVAATGAALGRPASTLRVLALGVGAVLLVDPLLATSLGFRLSVAGAAGIVVGAGRIERVLPGPRWLAAPLSVTLAAQLAVAPLLVAAFGAVPVASLPANLLALPAAGPVMVWGLTGGLVAGLGGPAVATAVHLPTRALVAWIDGVATAAARWPLGQLRAGHVALLAVAAAAAVAAGVRARPEPDGDGEPPSGPAQCRHVGVARGCAALVAIVVLVHAAAAAGGSGVIDGEAVGPGAQLWQDGGAAAVIVDGRAREEALLAGLRDRGVARVDVVVLRTAAPAAAEVAATLRRRWPRVVVLGSAGSAAAARRVANLGSVAVPTAGTVVDVGGLRLTVEGSGAERLDVGVVLRRAQPDSARAPPLPGR